jgi:hypothetical protein
MSIHSARASRTFLGSAAAAADAEHEAACAIVSRCSADVNFKVVKAFIDRSDRAMGQDVPAPLVAAGRQDRP